MRFALKNQKINLATRSLKNGSNAILLNQNKLLKMRCENLNPCLPK